MSIKLMTRVWELKLPHDELWVLMALADHADDDGRNCYPSVGYLAWKCGYSERSIQRILRKLEEKQYIKATSAQHGGIYSTTYQLKLRDAPSKEPYQKKQCGRPRKTDANVTPIFEKPVTTCLKPVTPEVKTGDVALAPEPSVNHQKPKENVSSPISPDRTLDQLWQSSLDRVQLSPTLAQHVHTLRPLTWADGVLILHAPAYLASRRWLADALGRLLAPVAPVELREVRVVNGA
jgi:hypothetical protein